MLDRKRIVSQGGLALKIARRPGGLKQLLAVGLHRVVPATFAELPLPSAVRLAYNTILRRDPTPAELGAALEGLRSGALDSDGLLDSLQSSYPELPLPVALRLGYTMLLRREPDEEGANWVREQFEKGFLDRFSFLDWLRGTGEFVSLGFKELGPSLHSSRCQFVRSLPPADRILDLGGTDLGHVEGAFVKMGYPYDFSELVVVDLLPEERHPLYQRSGMRDTVHTARGPVRYAYHSMTDLSRYDTDGFDLVYSGQTFEHVSEADGDLVLKDVHRVLKPGGVFALDTPNARICRMQQDEFIDPDHEVEYTVEQLRAKLQSAGFRVDAAWGLNYAGPSATHGRFSAEETAGNSGVFSEIEDCYLLALVCRHAELS